MTESIGWKLRQTWNHTFFIPKSKFNVEDIPDLSGKVIIVTGGNTGIGKETVNVRWKSAGLYLVLSKRIILQALLNRNAKVYMASRSREKAESAIADLATESGKRAIFLELDLADFASVKKAAQVFQRYGLFCGGQKGRNYLLDSLVWKMICMFCSTTGELNQGSSKQTHFSPWF